MCRKFKFVHRVTLAIPAMLLVFVLAYKLWTIDLKPIGRHSYALVVSHKNNKTAAEHLSEMKATVDGWVVDKEKRMLQGSIRLLNNKLDLLHRSELAASHLETQQNQAEGHQTQAEGHQTQVVGSVMADKYQDQLQKIHAISKKKHKY